MTPGVHTSEIRVRLKEVAYDHVYFGTVFTWFEVGRSEFSRAVGSPYRQLEERGLGSFVTSAFADYHRPIPPTGTVRLETRLAAMTRARCTFRYAVYPSCSTDPAVTGQSDHLMADLDGRPRRIPAPFAASMTATGETIDTVELDGPVETAWTDRLRLRYEETDAFRVVYHGNYFAWMEAAWSGHLMGGLWDIALNMRRGRALSVLHAACRYLFPAQYDDEVTIEVGAVQIGRTKIRLDYRFAAVTPSGTAGKTLALGRTIHAVIDGGRIVRVPSDLRDALGVSPTPEATRPTPADCGVRTRRRATAG